MPWCPRLFIYLYFALSIPWLPIARPLPQDSFPVVESRSVFGVTPLPVTVGDSLEALLRESIDKDAPNRFILSSPIHPTALGGEDPLKSDRSLWGYVRDKFTFTDPTKGRVGTANGASGEAWVDLYVKYLQELGEKATKMSGTSSLRKQFKIIDKHYHAMTKFGREQVQLVTAFYKEKEGDIASVGIALKEKPTTNADDPIDAVSVSTPSLGEMESWAEAGNGSDVGYGKRDYNEYAAAKKSYLSVKNKYEKLSFANFMLAESYTMENRLFRYPSLVNFSMLTYGKANDSTGAKVVPAWKANIVGTLGLGEEEEKQLRENLKRKEKRNINPLLIATKHAKPKSPSKREINPLILATTNKADNRLKGLASGMLGLAKFATRSDKDSEVDGKSAVAAATSATTTELNTESVKDTPDPLNAPLRGALVLVELKEGEWAEYRDLFINFGRKEGPELVNKYFNIPEKDWKEEDTKEAKADKKKTTKKGDKKKGTKKKGKNKTSEKKGDEEESTEEDEEKDTKKTSGEKETKRADEPAKVEVGMGPIGRRWTHAILLTLPKDKKATTDTPADEKKDKRNHLSKEQRAPADDVAKDDNKDKEEDDEDAKDEDAKEDDDKKGEKATDEEDDDDDDEKEKGEDDNKKKGGDTKKDDKSEKAQAEDLDVQLLGMVYDVLSVLKTDVPTEDIEVPKGEV